MSQTDILPPVTAIAPIMSDMSVNAESTVPVKNDVMNRIAITKLNICGCYTHKSAVATNDTCQLCKQQLTAPSLENMQKGQLSVQIAIGNCDHTFHKTCIDSYLAKNISCPIDKTPWVTASVYTFKNVESYTLNDNNDFNKTNIPNNDKSTFDNKVKILKNLI